MWPLLILNLFSLDCQKSAFLAKAIGKKKQINAAILTSVLFSFFVDDEEPPSRNCSPWNIQLVFQIDDI
jgi:hypothetical protein